MNINMNQMNKINEQELQSVTGGCPWFIVEPEAPGPRYTYIHSTCGGKIENVGNLIKNCRCTKCGEEHYTCFSFDYTEIDRYAAHKAEG